MCVREDGGSLKALYALHYCDRPMRWQRAREKVREERRCGAKTKIATEGMIERERERERERESPCESKCVFAPIFL